MASDHLHVLFGIPADSDAPYYCELMPTREFPSYSLLLSPVRLLDIYQGRDSLSLQELSSLSSREVRLLNRFLEEAHEGGLVISYVDVTPVYWRKGLEELDYSLILGDK